MQSSSAPSTTGEASSASSRGSSSAPFAQPGQQSPSWYNDASSTSQSQPAEMIGPAPNFYDPNEVPVQDNHQHYQRWVDYVGQQQQQTAQDSSLDHHAFDRLYFQSATSYNHGPPQNQISYPQQQQSSGYGTLYPGLLPMTEGGAPSPDPHSAHHTSYGGTPEPTYQGQSAQLQPPSSVAPRGYHHQPKPSYPVHPGQLSQAVFHGVGSQFERRPQPLPGQTAALPTSGSMPWATDSHAQRNNNPASTKQAKNAPRGKESPLTAPKTTRVVSTPAKAIPLQRASDLALRSTAAASSNKTRTWSERDMASADPDGSDDDSDEPDIEVGVPGSTALYPP